MSTVLSKRLRTVNVPPRRICEEREVCYTPSGSNDDGTTPDGGAADISCDRPVQICTELGFDDQGNRILVCNFQCFDGFID